MKDTRAAFEAMLGGAEAPRPVPTGPRRHYRALFISDVHMGARGCRVEMLVDFLTHVSADTIYLVGDIFDSWVPIGKHWTPAHDMAVRLLLDLAEAGARIVYLPGNHDAFMRRHLGVYFSQIEVVDETRHTAIDGREYLVLHGDQCDIFQKKRARWISLLGAHVDSGLRGLSSGVNRVRRILGMDEFIVIERALLRFNSLIRYGNRFEKRLAKRARQGGYDGVICGHFHKPALHDDFGVTYANCGDWIDSFTAVTENRDGGLDLLHWAGTEATEPAGTLLPETEDAPGWVA
ncbi:UDP-2,3-diacylglucosamine diphosphatase [Acidimangrovimonas sediminis]|uniref:UDP-2,3-diacylglucosamine diphosphatase n=1 Tax=Acidimangrovimonas sediminis TaxID=2056283 RepID=UPI001E54FD18|nr:UDP-2,3-diacylglucosamine diphosphatase [Acidimangrovimonas sediminis]